MHRARRLLAALLIFAAPTVVRAEWQAKVDPWVLDRLALDEAGETDFLIVLAERADLSGAARLSGKVEKAQFVYEALTATAESSQAALRDELERAAIPFQPFWIANMIWARGDAGAVASLAARPDVLRIAANPRVSGEAPAPGAAPAAPESPEAVAWNVAKVNAPGVWALGFTGQGAVVAGQDTGYEWTHPALRAKYRGWNGTAADHDYNWHDAIHSGGGVCAPNSLVPCDDDTMLDGHGTHTMGTMVGDDGAGNQIGVAPGAKWIGCRNMDQGIGTPASYAECYQWFLAPTDLAGANPDPAQAPDVINNSWGCPESEGCTDPNVMQDVVEAVRQAGIVTVQAAGNGGPSCSTVNKPSAIYRASFSVGNTTATDVLNSDAVYGSARGPVTVDGSGRRKPDIAAPGTSIRSSLRGGLYGTLTGTSQAGPHVAGLVALLISADPALAGNVDALEELLRESAFTGVSASGSCGGTGSAAIPNNLFGWGRIDALAAVELRQSGFLFRDGFETGLADDWSAVSPGF
jgi:subtilisin family serine protease